MKLAFGREKILVSIETEVKLHVADVTDFLKRLRALTPIELSARHFEDNFVLDFDENGLRFQSCLLRVRITDRGASITFKGPPREGGAFKVREELETAVGNGDIAILIFERLGMKVWFRYQKYRREFAVGHDVPPGANVHVAYDETPIGDYVELEGSEDNIRKVAEAMGFNESQFIRLSYYSLFREYCEARCQEPGFMVFVS
jgi:adenylate cyclase class 2